MEDYQKDLKMEDDACRYHTLGYPIMYSGPGQQTPWGKNCKDKTC